MRPDRIRVPSPDVWCGLLPAPRRSWLQVGDPCVQSGLWRVCFALVRGPGLVGSQGTDRLGSGSRVCGLLHAGLLCIRLLPLAADRVPRWHLTAEGCSLMGAAVFLPSHFFPNFPIFVCTPSAPVPLVQTRRPLGPHSPSRFLPKAVRRVGTRRGGGWAAGPSPAASTSCPRTPDGSSWVPALSWGAGCGRAGCLLSRPSERGGSFT